VGNTLRADDAAGILAVRALSELHPFREDRLLILEAGHAPENQTGELRRFAPDLVLFIDAAEMGAEPGTIRCVPEENIGGMSASTHSLPLSMLACYLTLELGCKVILLGIQPASNEVGGTVSEPVSQAILEVAETLEYTILSVPTSTVHA
jgi:hydrogenase 3 maturation protease